MNDSTIDPNELALRLAWEKASVVRAKAFDALPPILQKRVEGFRQRRPNSFWRYEDVEIASCSIAREIVYECPTLEAVKSFVEKPLVDQVKMIKHLPGMYLDDPFSAAIVHAAALRIAEAYRTSEEACIQAHAAICPVVGCEKVGCWLTISNTN